MKITNYVGNEKEDIFAHCGASGTKGTNTIEKRNIWKKEELEPNRKSQKCMQL